jgi:hypothetical protein
MALIDLPADKHVDHFREGCKRRVTLADQRVRTGARLIVISLFDDDGVVLDFFEIFCAGSTSEALRFLDDAGGFGAFFCDLSFVAGDVFLVGCGFSEVAKSSRLVCLLVLLRVVTIVASDPGYLDCEFQLGIRC